MQNFQDLRDALAEGEHKYKALKVNYNHTLEVIDKERLMAREYYRHMRNAEVQIQYLMNELPLDYDGPAVAGFSQAKF